MSDLDKSNPEFTISIRGYDRLQVDDYVSRLHQLLAVAEDRARDAESELEFSRHTTVGPRVNQIFELAVAESKEMRKRVEEEVKARIAAAREQADELVENARRAADELAAQSQRERDETVAAMQTECERIQAEVMHLEDQRAQMLDELRRLHDALGHVASLASPTLGHEQHQQLEPGDQEPTVEQQPENPDAAAA